jgi:hypothetical protein
MAEAAAAFEKLGFILTPFVAHRVAGTAGEPPQPAGTGNRCAMLHRGYLEILAAVSDVDTQLSRLHNAAIARYTGVHLLAFTTADAEAAHTHLSAQGFEPVDPMRLRRPLNLPNGSVVELAFTVIRVPPDAMPEGRIQMLTQETPDLVWQPHLIASENGIAELSGALLCVDDPVEVAERYGRFLGRAAEGDDDFRTILLDRGRLGFATPARCAALLPGIELTGTPRMPAVSLLAGDVEMSREFFVSRKIQLLFERRRGFCIHPDAAAGAALVIHSREEPWLQS